jgi:hypothetical protein
VKNRVVAHLSGRLEAKTDGLDKAELAALDLGAKHALLVLKDVALLLVGAFVLLQAHGEKEG